MVHEMANFEQSGRFELIMNATWRRLVGLELKIRIALRFINFTYTRNFNQEKAARRQYKKRRDLDTQTCSNR